MKTNTLPEMIFFDYGNTLCSEPYAYQGALGFSLLLGHASKNPMGATGEQLLEFQMSIATDAARVNALDAEINHRETMRVIMARFGIELELSELETEDVFWNSAFPAEPIDGVNEAMELLTELNIRTAVVSNMSFSSEALRLRIDRHVPSNRFEFIIASSDYFYRKPRPELFLAALGKAGVDPTRCAFCGDSVVCDILPSSRLGMQPLWMRSFSESRGLEAQAQKAGAEVFDSWGQFSDYIKNMRDNGEVK